MANWMRPLALSLGLICGGFWTYFGVASGIYEKESALGVLIHATLPGLVLLLTLAIGWRWGRIGGGLLIAEGAFVMIAYPLMVRGRFSLATIVFVLATLALPPLVSGALLVLSHQGAAP